MNRFILCLALCVVLPADASAQKGKGAFQDFLRLGVGASQEAEDTSIKISTELTEDSEPGVVQLSIDVELPQHFYIYSTNPECWNPTRIKFDELAGLRPLGDTFDADRDPKRVQESAVEQDVEKFYDRVTWTRRFQATRSDVSLKGRIEGSYCSSGENGACLPIRPPFEFEESLSGLTVASKADDSGTDVGPFRFEVTPADPIKLTFELPPDGQPGDEIELAIRMDLEGKWHTFAQTQNPENAGLPTTIEIEKIAGLEATEDRFQPDRQPSIEFPLEDLEQQTFHNSVTWTRKYRVTGNYGLSGALSYQICSGGSCRPQIAVPFILGSVGESLLMPVVASAGTAERGGKINLEFEEEQRASGFGVNLFYAFLGGLILNVMPCVLPVIAIKILSFVQQAGESRARIFALNLAYSIGVLAVFLVLAFLAVSAKYGWGQLFQHNSFNAVMACMIFAMALSLLGVYELPIPGLVGSAAGTQQKEGLTGAFTTGIFATLLATPCAGPFVGTTLFWAAKQPATVAFLIFISMGIGMAFPYLLIGAFPRLVNWLPKPGMWMVRLKEFAGFVLMGTVILILTWIDYELVIPTLTIILGIAVATWMLGSLYNAASPLSRKWKVRFAALATAAAICGFGFTEYRKGSAMAELRREDGSSVVAAVDGLPWEPFSSKRLEELVANGQPVLVDFTADWCLICKQNEKLALNTSETIEFVKSRGVVPLYADWTKKDPEITEWLDRFQQQGVPLTVIFPTNTGPGRPVLRLAGPYTQGTLLEKLREAVSSDDTSNRQRVSSRTGDSPAVR